MSSLERIATFNIISNSLYLIRVAMISTFVLWTSCEAVYMFLTAVQKVRTLSKTKKRCVEQAELYSVFECAPMFLKSKKHSKNNGTSDT